MKTEILANLSKLFGFFIILLALVAAPISSSKAKSSALSKNYKQANTNFKSKDFSNSSNRVERKGLVVEFFSGSGEKKYEGLVEGDYADIHFKITDAHSHQPLKGLNPGAWLDIGSPLTGKGPESGSCKGKVETYLKGVAGVRPMLDLTSYYILVFNQDNSISVIDPLVGITGKTNLFATIILKASPGDWAKSLDSKRIYVTLPGAGQVAVVDTDNFKVINTIEAGSQPMRIALQPDGRYLWIGNDASVDEAGGVTVIDTKTLKVVNHISTGKGHHELAFSDDDRYAYISNREKGSVSVIDIDQAKKIKDIQTGLLPISLAYSKIAQALYVADGVDGSVSVISGSGQDFLTTIKAKPGLGPMRITPDGRWILVVNSRESLVQVLEVATNRLVQNIPVGAKPYQIAFSNAFAYIRSLDSEHVGMISLAHLGKEAALQISTFAVGSMPPKEVADLGIGASVAQAVGEAAVVVVSPADNLIYYYMEGMLAPSGNFRNPGHSARAIEVVDRGLQETQPGIYSARVKIPVAGNYDVAFLLESPRLIQCFHAEAKPNPAVRVEHESAEIEYINASTHAKVGETVQWRFRLDDPQSHQPKTGLDDVRVLYYLAPGLLRTELPAREIEGGVYLAELPIRRAGAYYIYIGIPSLKLKFGDLPYRNLLASD
jgi:YVTN family beta-propeller protein